MKKELYFDIVSEEGAGALYRLDDGKGPAGFYYHYSTTDLETDKVANYESEYPSFSAFWKVFVSDTLWFCLHPLFLHPEQRVFVQKELQKVNWSVVQDEKWQEMYQRQWNKVLHAPATYYKPER